MPGKKDATHDDLLDRIRRLEDENEKLRKDKLVTDEILDYLVGGAEKVIAEAGEEK
jgi:hypothetical protein